MLKEIYEQPNAIKDTYRGRLLANEGLIKMSGIDDHIEKFTNADRIIIVACGTSWHAGLVSEYIFEEFSRIPVEVEYASEFRYRNPIISEKDVIIAISQSGETADTLAAIKLAKSKGAFVLEYVMLWVLQFQEKLMLEHILTQAPKLVLPLQKHLRLKSLY